MASEPTDQAATTEPQPIDQAESLSWGGVSGDGVADPAFLSVRMEIR